MEITRIKQHKNPDRVSRKLLLDTDRLVKNPLKKFRFKRFNSFEEFNEWVDSGIDKVTGMLIDLIG